MNELLDFVQLNSIDLKSNFSNLFVFSFAVLIHRNELNRDEDISFQLNDVNKFQKDDDKENTISFRSIVDELVECHLFSIDQASF